MRGGRSCWHASYCSLQSRLLQLLLCKGHLQKVLQLLQLVQQVVAGGVQAEVLCQLLVHSQHLSRRAWRSCIQSCNQQVSSSCCSSPCRRQNSKSLAHSAVQFEVRLHFRRLRM
jgi:hypothetical protein